MPTFLNGHFDYGSYVCQGNRWIQQNAACGESQTTICEIDGTSYSVGATVLIDQGPKHLECTSPGKWVLKEMAAGVSSSQTSSRIGSEQVKRAQTFLFKTGVPEFDPKACTREAVCDGLMSDATRAAILAFLQQNFSSLSDERRSAWQAESESELTDSFKKLNDIDVIYYFNNHFDTPNLVPRVPKPRENT